MNMVCNMETARFHKLADELLQSLSDYIETANYNIEVDYLQGILNISLPDGKEYVLNKHEPSKQIWLSSPFSGAHKFTYNEARNIWIGYDKEELLELLKSEITNL